MKLLPLIGALLISAAPVQAFETFEELNKACSASEENTNMCAGAVEYGGAAMTVSVLCDLEEKGRLTKENVVLTWDELVKRLVKMDGWTPLLNEVVEGTLEKFPECSLKPLLP